MTGRIQGKLHFIPTFAAIVRPALGEVSFVQLQGTFHSSFNICNTSLSPVHNAQVKEGLHSQLGEDSNLGQLD